ncbi:tRNA (guanosine(46)-N7)-methyltransferase TrmB [Helicobacter acinonychis]|uniref:tRNA (guanine-N(7)-)-methyltransferase n=1 Tax=Helicobacter acinonychis (strain Sheeba) TaxID=382638 RepID=TRMB_HELAH|nr:tRNA (guanosine(46)-N7)-methyltransferase TrmB [Helicobacter acinonychis]Q17Y01.1 RecName: Full=tRNA (guanine-N(7)-)-methyltransferase; AltName: Full=tRNA (guanine(46)-N(7))-methyltransferase; AltName: Full=tRNA(m7G46)-methyltransferase [Helicobacter acinonychis str. Sheeba]CAJ99475.1 tRNA (guanine-N7-)-methyltransferase [Helicobacter acinonychis str. Sheeba]STP04047.1 tRNA (guanine-N(7)-)-methyltransferase [Helicobacter acinonychis]
MPHFLAKLDCKPLEYPIISGDFCFHKEFSSLKHPTKSCVYASFKDHIFLLQKIRRANDFLIKSEKATPLKREILKQALRIYAQSFEVILHNLQENSKHASGKKALDLEDFEDFIKENQAPILMEIGFGSGRHLMELAKNNPTKTCLGIEIYTPSIAQVLKQIELLDLKNLHVLQGDGRLVLESIPHHKCEKIFVHFPVPWNDKKHRRVLSERFLDEALRVLEPNGFLELRTDDTLYFEDSLKLALKHFKSEIEIKKNAQIPVVSKYEARWNKLKKDIYDLRIYSLESNETPFNNHAFDFSFDTITLNQKSVGMILKTPKIIKEGYFVHVCNIYENKGDFLVELSMGDFDWPMRLFVLSVKNQVFYLNKSPLKTLNNHKAHLLLQNILKEFDEYNHCSE